MKIQRYLHKLAVGPCHIIAITLICIIAFVLRVLFITHESLDGDELASLYFAHFPFFRLWTEALDTHPPLYYSIQRIMLALGDSEALLRAPSTLLGTLSVLLTYLLTRRIVGGSAALLAAAFMAISASQITYSEWARPYALLTAAALGVALAAVRIFSNYARAALSTSGGRALYVLSMTIALYSHNLACLLFGVTAIFGLAPIVANRSLKCFLEWIALNGAVLLLWWWWLIVVVHQAAAGLTNLSWLAPPTLSSVQANLSSAYGPQFIWYFKSIIQIVTLIVVGLVIISAGIIIIRTVPDRMIPLAYIFVLSFCIPAAAIVISFVWRPVFMDRYLIWVVPFYYILLALVITSSFRSSWFIGGILSGVAAIFILDLGSHYIVLYNDNYRTLVDQIYNASQTGDVIVTFDPFEYVGVNYYLSKHSPRALTVVDLDPSATHLPSASVANLPPAADRIWLALGKEGQFRAGSSQTTRNLASYRLLRRYDEKNVVAELYQARESRARQRYPRLDDRSSDNESTVILCSPIVRSDKTWCRASAALLPSTASGRRR